MSEYINEDIFENEEFKRMQAIAEEVRAWPEWKRMSSAYDNYSQSQMRTKNSTSLSKIKERKV